ncbi:MAG TPA: helix-turn-helix domain-containing protein [Acidimicrobiales bacterium]|nr:helix-turn-helix domain-containing protein [Acidimicrobiales bacterium]
MVPDTGAVLVSMGERLRSARECAGLTLDQTAELAGLSKAHLSRLESAERQPSIAALLTLADVLGTPVSALLGEQRSGTALAISTDGDPRRESRGLAIASCSGYPGSTALEALRITVDPDRPVTAPARHRGEEWLYVLHGILRLEYDGETHHLGPGVSAHFDADRPHRLGAEGVVAEVLLVAAKDPRNMQNIH